ncbi:hypothetical protein JCM6882_000267 [Rhodosporidiobolus microsporus]
MASARPAESLYFSTTIPPALAVLNLADTERYLERIGLPASLADAKPSLELLEKLLMANHLTIPFSSASIHVPAEDWLGPNKPIELRRGPGMELGKKNFERLITKKQGGYCYSTNPTCAAFLRGFGFRVSEIGARVYLHRGKDPREVGIWWSQMTHVALLVDWEGSEDRWLFDIGFGGGACPIPIPLRDGATTHSLSKNESFLLREETMPVGDLQTIPDPPRGFTLYRRVVPAGYAIEDPATADADSVGFWTPAQHLTIATIAPEDMVVADFYSSFHPEAAWTNAFVVSLLLPNGARRTLAHGIAALARGAPQDGRKYAKLYTKEAIKGEEYDVEWVPFETEPIRKVLEKEYGFLF